MYFIREHLWLILIAAGALLLWGLSLTLVRHFTRRRLLQVLLAQELKEEDLEPTLPEARPQDQAALEVVRAFRRRHLWRLRPTPQLSFKKINEMSLKLIQEVARIYFPEEERPELKASLADLVALHNRVGARLAAWLETFPVRPIKDVEIKTVLRYHDLYRDLKDHPGYRFIKGYYLDKVVSWGWSVYNYASPWHWGRKAAYEGGKEVVMRLLFARIVDFVGEEAILIYSRR